MLARQDSEKRYMRVRLRQFGDQLCIPLPPAVASTPAFASGEVEIEWEPSQGILVVRTGAAQQQATHSDQNFGEAVEQVLSSYGNTFVELVQSGQ
jgi:hypothetical protein